MPVLSIFLAFGLFALSMFGHHRDAFGRSPSKAIHRLCYWGAWCSLVCSYFICVVTLNWGYGSILFFGYMTGAALVVVLCLTYFPRVLPGLMGLSLLLLPFTR